MNIHSLLSRLKSLNITLQLVGEQMSVSAPEGVLTAEITGELKKNRAAIIQFLKRIGADSHKIIPTVPVQDWYALSSAQQRLWIIDRMEGAVVTYTIPSLFRLRGALDREKLERAFAVLVMRHESLRTTFALVGDIPRQRVLSYAELPFRMVEEDLRGKPEQVVRERAQEWASRPFDLGEGPLFRVGLMRVGEAEYLLFLSFHHIIFDEWSMKVLMQELVLLYNADKPGSLSELAIQYKDYAAWQLQELEEGRLVHHRQYWVDRLSGELPVLDLPTDRPRPVVMRYEGDVVHHRLSEDWGQSLQQLSGAHTASSFMVVMALVRVLLYRYTGQEDLVIGTPVAGRDHPELEGQIGFYVNTLALRTKVDGSKGFIPALELIQSDMLEAYTHQGYPFDKLVEELQVGRDMSRSPLFDVLVVMQHEDAAVLGLTGVAVEEMVMDIPVSKFDMSLYFKQKGDELWVSVEYNTAIYDRSRIERMVGHLEELLHRVLLEPRLPLQALKYLTVQEAEEIVNRFNDTDIDHLGESTLVELLEGWAMGDGDRVALICEGRRWSFGELNARANQLAHYLREEKGVRRGQPVGLLMERSEWLLVGIWGILKAGGFYVPMDIQYPSARIDYITADAGLSYVVTDRKEDWEKISTCSVHDPERVSMSDDLCYMIYTSGSTGQPKGVEISHKSVVNVLYSVAAEIGMAADELLLAVTTPAFDMSVIELMMPMVRGGTVLLSTSNDPVVLKRLLENGVTIMQATPSQWEMLVESGWEGDKRLKVITGGEALPLRLGKVLQGLAGGVWNMYGPTETTVYAAYYKLLTSDEEVLIGRPVSNLRAYILDEGMQLVGKGLAGTLYVGGMGLARGYHDRAELTVERFVDNPFGVGRLYNTGDRCIWTGSGLIRYMGRKDDQVKLRGYRIELGEVGAVLQGYEGISQVIVVLRNQSLWAYYVSDQEYVVSELRAYMQGQLPAYMVPAYFVWLAAMPLTANGKIDKAALPVVGGLGGKAYVAPGTVLEEQLARIWQEVLGLEQIGMEDNFFEIGGHSLRAIQVISRIYRDLSVRLELRELFLHPVLKMQAGLIQAAGHQTYSAIERVVEQPTYALSHAQRRLWVLEQQQKGQLTYHIATTYRLEGMLDLVALGSAFDLLIERHESLRTIFELVDGEPRQRILSREESGFRVEYTDLRGGGLAEADGTLVQPAVARLVEDEMRRPFDLGVGPLLRVRVIQLAGQRWLILFSSHHIISDEWSMQVLVKELLLLYNADKGGVTQALPALPIQYKDYSVWQLNELGGPEAGSHRQYWMGRFSGELPVLDLPSDRPRPLIQSFGGGHVSFELPGEGLLSICREHSATLFMGLLALVKTLLYRYSGQEDLIIGTPVAGRDHPDLEAQIGYYLNTLALRTKVDTASGFGDLLEAVKQTTLDAFSHQVYPFDLLIEDLKIIPAPGRSPLFDVVVILQNIQLNGSSDLVMEGVTVEMEEADLQTSKGDLRFQWVEQDGLLAGNIEYNTDLYDRERIDRMIRHLGVLLELVTADVHKPLAELQYRDAAEDDRNEWFRAKIASPDQPLLHEVFEACSLRYPAAIAVEEENEKVDYSSLNVRANRLAHQLIGLGLQPGQVVGVGLASGIRLVSSLLAVFKSGGVYLPLDLSLPQRRLEQMFMETRPQVLIVGQGDREQIETLAVQGLHVPWLVLLPESAGTLGSLVGELALPEGALIGLGEAVPEVMKWEGKEYEPIESGGGLQDINPGLVISGDADSYIFYTSGSTGKGKGILGSYKSLSHYIHWHIRQWGIGPEMRISQIAPVTFDASLKDILVALCSGATLCIPQPATKQNMELLSGWLREYSVNILQTVPSLFRLLTRAVGANGLPALRQVLLSGEKLYGRDVLNWRAVNGEQATLNNLYGLTETTILKSCYPIVRWDWEPGDLIPIGQGISNTLLAVLNQDHVCEEGEVGDIYIKSPFVTKGYLDKSLELFIQNPLVRGHVDLVCRTGDIGRYRPDGSVEVLGRRDEQVKIHGVRVELNEIRTAMLALTDISQVELVVNQDEEGVQEVVCYYMGRERTIAQLREELSGWLSGSLLPAYFIWMEEFPLNINGKVDRKALPKPEALSKVDAYIAPKGPIEEGLARIWQQLLGAKRIGRTDSFFTMGGSSLKAIQVISRIYKEFEVQLSIAEVFNHPTLSVQAGLIQAAQKQSYAAIGRVEEQASYALSHAQRRLWALDQRQQDALPFNGLEVFRLEGLLDREVLASAFGSLIDRHESLRTIFELVDGEPRQRILSREESGFRVDYTDLRGEGLAGQGGTAGIDAQQEAAVAKLIEQEARMPFDLSVGPMLRVRVVQLAEQRWLILFASHHIISDEWSMQVLVKEVLLLYNAYKKGALNPLPPLPIQYKDYSAWQLNELGGPEAGSHRQYWMDRFSGELPVLDLPSDRPRPLMQTFKGDHVFFELPADGLLVICREHGATLFMGLLALVKTLLYRYSGQEDLIIGTPVAGRDHPDLEAQIGYYLNTLALRTKVDATAGFGDLLEAVKQTTLDAFSHQVYPFDLLIEDLQVVPDPSRSPLFDIAMILQNISLNTSSDLTMDGVRIENVGTDLRISKGDLRFQWVEQNGLLAGNIEYNTDLYDRGRIDRMIRHLGALLELVTADANKPLSELEYRDAAEDDRNEWFRAKIASPDQPLLHEVFEACSLRYPTAIAIEEEREQIDYSSLNVRANRLAHQLIGLGLQPGQVVGVGLASGIRLVSSLLAVFKSGGIYLPLDLSLPQRRLEQMFIETRPQVLIVGQGDREQIETLAVQGLHVPWLVLLPESAGTLESLVGELALPEGALIGLGEALPEVMKWEGKEYRPIEPGEGRQAKGTNGKAGSNGLGEQVEISGDADSYIFYTSGSTGKGKGILGSYKSLSHYIHWHIRQWGIGPEMRISQIAPVTFDASLKDILVALCSGATLCIPQPATKQNMELLAGWLRECSVNILQTVPSLFRLLTRAVGANGLPALRQVLLSGEKLYGRDVLNWRAVNGERATLNNLYGLTETTILKSCYPIVRWDWEPGDLIPIGQGISNTLVAVLNQDHVCEEGEVGDIYIKSPFVTKGYLDKSLELFIQNPLVRGHVDLVCRTGDIGRYRPDGSIEVLGRRDEQVKIHGVRVELNEIRTAMLALTDISQVELVVNQDEEGVQEVVCYYMGRERTVERLREELSGWLSGSLLPAYFIWMEEFPLNINGKVDRKALPKPEALSKEDAYEAPQGPIEEGLSHIWQQLLGVKRVGRFDSFFTMGGSSLKAIQVISRIYKEFEVQLTIAEVFNHPTLSVQAGLIQAARKQSYAAIGRVEEQASYALSHAQRRLWVLDQRQQDALPFNGLEVFRLEGHLDQEVLESAFGSLIDRHESLRTIFELVDGEPRQKVLGRDESGFSVEYTDLRGGGVAGQGRAAGIDAQQEAAVAKLIEQEARMPFDLSVGPMLRVRVVQLADHRWLILFASHHIISDEWSMQVLVKELLLLYNAYKKGASNPLAPLPIQYKDYAAWQLAALHNEHVNHHQQYWLRQFAGELPVLDLPSDRTRPLIQTFKGNHVPFVLPEESCEKLLSLCRDHGATLFMGLLALVKVLLYRYSGQEDLILGTPVAGRDHRDLETQIGYYLNTLALRTRVDGQSGFGKLLGAVKQTTLDAFSHQVYPFDLLIEDLKIIPAPGRSPLFDVVVILQNIRLNESSDLLMDGVTIENLGADLRVSKGDLRFQFIEEGNRIEGNIEYNTDLYDRSRIERMCWHLGSLLSAIVNDADRPIRNLQYISEDESLQIVNKASHFTSKLSEDY